MYPHNSGGYTDVFQPEQDKRRHVHVSSNEFDALSAVCTWVSRSCGWAAKFQKLHAMPVFRAGRFSRLAFTGRKSQGALGKAPISYKRRLYENSTVL